MIKIFCSLSPKWNSSSNNKNLESADEWDLDYGVLLGDVSFVVNSSDFSMKWGWIPLVDFIKGLRFVLKELEEGKLEAAFGPPETDAHIKFTRNGQTVILKTNYAEGAEEIPFDELRGAVDKESVRLRDVLIGKYPELSRNEKFMKAFH